MNRARTYGQGGGFRTDRPVLKNPIGRACLAHLCFSIPSAGGRDYGTIFSG
jgi:hypothetical protein